MDASGEQHDLRIGRQEGINRCKHGTRRPPMPHRVRVIDVRVGMISIAEDGRGPLTVPIWYGYTPGGDLSVWMAKASRKAVLLQRAGRFSLCVQTEQRPYQYVS